MAANLAPLTPGLSADLLTSATEEILAKFQQAWSFDGRDFNRPNSEETLRRLIAENPVGMHKRLNDEFFAEGPLAAILSTPQLQEIIVNGPDDIWIESAGKFRRHDDRFLSETTFKNFIDRLCAEAAVKIDLAQPFTDGRWRDFRIHMGCAPLTHCAFHLNLRRLPSNPWTLPMLEGAGWASPARMTTLRDLIRKKKNILFIGPTGCGKTTVLGACLRELEENERAIIIEDTDELLRPNSASAKLLTRPSHSPALPEVGLTDLVRQSLRMRPHRLVMGEVRGAEAKDLLLALATGHSGSLGTLHASEPRQALLRLEMLVQLGAPQWNVQAIRQLIQLSVDYLVVCGNEDGGRRLEGIYRVAALESFGFLLEPV
jgi:pilus assembly protein CpaF